MKTTVLSAYADKHAICEVLGSFINEPHLMREYIVDVEDFPETFFKIIFASISNLYKSGAEVVDEVAIDEYLTHYEAQHKIFIDNDGISFIQSIQDMAEPSNIKYYYDRIKKFTLLRRFVEEGQSVKFFFDPNEIAPQIIEQQRDNLENYTVADIIKYYRQKHISVAKSFIGESGKESKKAGEGGEEQIEKWKKSTAWGIGYSSAYLTTILHGLRPRRFTVKSAGTGVGKTRTAIADLGYSCAPAFYNKEIKKWEVNNNGTNFYKYTS